MKNIKIKTARISNILQSTVNYQQAFTELVKKLCKTEQLMLI